MWKIIFSNNFFQFLDVYTRTSKLHTYIKNSHIALYTMHFCSVEFVYEKTLFWILAILRWNVLWPRADPRNIKFLVEKQKEKNVMTPLITTRRPLFPIQIIHLLATIKIRLKS